MRIKVTLENQEFIALIDSGSTHNFVNHRIAEAMRLPVKPTEPFSVRVTNGERLTCKGKYENITVDIQGIKFHLDFFFLPLSGLDLVLGIQWLQTLGSVMCDWNKLTMTFMWDNNSQQIKGIEVVPIKTVTAQSLAKDFCWGQTLFLLCLQSNQQLAFEEVHLEMQAILQAYSKIFAESKSLLPTLEIDHNILLKEGTEAINVRPYRYAYFQKDEIEK